MQGDGNGVNYMNNDLSFEKAMQRLNEIIGLLEKQDISLDESMRLFEEGTGLCSYCDKELKNAEQKITNFDKMMKRDAEND